MIEGPFTNPRRVIRWLFLGALVMLFTWAFFLYLNAQEAEINAQGASNASPEALGASQTHDVDPCGLKDVVCPNEHPGAVPTNPAPDPQISSQVEDTIISTVYTYQAVEAQTDASPCSGAMPGIDFCNPPTPLVANNCLDFGTNVLIRGEVYLVADRMASRYGCDVFDILIDEAVTPWKWLNEPVYVL